MRIVYLVMLMPCTYFDAGFNKVRGLSILIYRQVSRISRTLVSNSIIDHSDVAGASPVGDDPTTSSFSTEHLGSTYWTKTTTNQDEKR